MTETSSNILFTEEKEKLAQKYNYEYGMILNGIVLPSLVVPDSYELSRTFETRPGDICLTAYSKSGSTWLIYNILLITQQGKAPEGRDLADNFLWPAFGSDYILTREQLRDTPSPRIFRSHMPYPMAMGGTPEASPCKYVYIARHPKDVVVSFYHFAQHWGNYTGPWEHWLGLFMEGKVWYGDWFDHIKSWWEHRHAENIHFLWYEDMKADYDNELRRLAAFLQYPMPDELLRQIREATSFEQMKANEFTNRQDADDHPKNFYRKGVVGSGNEQFTEAQNEQFDAWCGRRLRETGLIQEESLLSYLRFNPKNNVFHEKI
ncbi:MAG: sulfotransferase domain-containing protein [Phaeodactylibacter sp.]|nr:sulfotransferase domain-containing protein [Phaeodactylibacter sp.]